LKNYLTSLLKLELNKHYTKINQVELTVLLKNQEKKLLKLNNY